MTQINLEISISELTSNFDFTSDKKYRLIVIFGLLGDFDTFEYGINLAKNLKRKDYQKNLDVFAIAIGSAEGKKRFCKFTGFPEENLRIVSNNQIHNLVGASNGLDIGMGGWINMFLMLLGIGSPKTINEVVRGYIGDRKAKDILKEGDIIKIFNSISISGKLFSNTFGSGYLRPFELATIRLNNMIEIINNWKSYILNTKYLPQRTATFLINNKNEIEYKYFSKDILNYSKNMSSPLEFLDELFKYD